MQRSNWKNNTGGDEWSTLRQMSYEQRKFFQNHPTQNRFQYGQNENDVLYRRWLAAQERPYTAARTPIYAVDGSDYHSRRYSLDAPSIPTSPTPESIIYYNSRKRSIPFVVGQPSTFDDETSNTMLYYPQAIDIGCDIPNNVYSNAFYFNKNSTQSRTTRANAKIINTEQVVHNLTLFRRFLEVMQSWPLPHVSFTTACILVLIATFISPRLWAEIFIFPAFRLSFGTLYPAYASYKAVRTKNVKEYVKWMMYWIVYAFFTCIETFTDIFLAWFPFYYEVKVIIVLWLLSPATKGSSTLYRKFVHPMLTRREQEIDEYLNQAKERGYSAVLQLGTKGVNYATNVIMQTALKGGGNLVQTIRRSYSLSDLSEPDVHRTQDEIDNVVEMRSHQRMLRPRPQAGVARSMSGTRHSTGMYFSEVDVVKGADGFNYNIRSSDDISSGYSSADPVSAGLSRTSSMTNASKARSKGRRAEILNEPTKQIRRAERDIFPSHLEYDTGLEGCEPLETLFDVDNCMKSLNETSSGPLEDYENKEMPPKQQQTEQITDENNDVEKFSNSEKGKNEEYESLSKDPVQPLKNENECQVVAGNLAINISTGEINEMDEISIKDNGSIYNSSDIHNIFENCDVHNDDYDEFSDALPSLADDEDELDEEVNKIMNNDNNDCIDFAQTITQEASATTDAQNIEKLEVNAKELQNTLQEIKDNFHANIVTITTTITPTSKLTTSLENKSLNPRPLTHNKGKAPAPPLPPRPARPVRPLSSNLTTAAATNVSSTAINSSLDAVINSSHSPSPALYNKSMFQNFKTNLFRFGSSSSVLGDKQNETLLEKSNRSTPPYETQL